jgi:hypothetical protein
VPDPLALISRRGVGWSRERLRLRLRLSKEVRDPGFSDKYERDYNIFNPINQYRIDNPLNPINEVNPNNPRNPINRSNPNTPFVPLNRPYGSGR